LRSVVTGGTGTAGVPRGFSDVAPAKAGVTGRWFRQEYAMQKFFMPIVAVAALGLATPASAYGSNDVISMQQALDVATDIGLVTVSHTEFAGDEWQIEGQDMSGRYMEVDVDAATGDVLNVDR
jgi:uncharacterized membrane protein YkoI